MTLAQRINGGLRRIPAWPLYGLLLLPACWYFWQALSGALGPEPIKPFEHALGRFSLKLFIVVLAVTPLRKATGVSLVKYRRAIGVMTFVYVALHLLVWLVLDVQIIAQIWADIVKRPYITIGMAGLVLLLPLAITSNNLAVRRLGPVRWRRLHWLTYPAVLLGLVHFVMVAKVWQVDHLVYGALILGLLAARIDWRGLLARGAALRAS